MTFATLKVIIYEEKLEEYLNKIFKKYFKSLNLYLYKYDRELEKVHISTTGYTKEEINFNESTTLSKIEQDLESLIYGGFLRSNLDCSISIIKCLINFLNQVQIMYLVQVLAKYK